MRWHRYVTHGHKAGYTYKSSSAPVRTQMVAAPLSCVLNHRFREARAGGGAVSDALARDAATEEHARPHHDVAHR